MTCAQPQRARASLVVGRVLAAGLTRKDCEARWPRRAAFTMIDELTSTRRAVEEAHRSRYWYVDIAERFWRSVLGIFPHR